MKIALVSPYDFTYPGGVTEHTVALAQGLQQRGFGVHVLAACSGYHPVPFANTLAVTRQVTAVPIRGATARVGLSPLSYLRIKKILRQEAFDVIHLQEPLTPGITWWTLLQTRALPQTVTIGTFHAYHEQPNWLYKHGRPIFAKIFARLNGLIAVSPAACQFAYQMFPGNYYIIPNGIDLCRFGRKTAQADAKSPQAKTTILFVGRLDKRKGFHTLLEAFIKLKLHYPQLWLQVIGPFEAGACRPYREMAQARGVTNIEFVGYVSPEQLPGYYHNADIFCAPSIGFESFGIVLLEAMAAGLPIVASDIAGYRSLIVHGQEGLLTPPGQAGPLARALRQLLNQPQLRQTMGHQGQLKAGLYSWERVVDETLLVYTEVIQRHLKSRYYHSETKNKATGSMQRRQPYHVKRSSTQI